MQPTESRYYILVGDSETWEVALKHNIWGFSETSRGYWNRSRKGDYLAFYVTAPVKKVIGFGKITRKFVSDDLIFPDELLFGKVIWEYRFEFEKIHLVQDWEKGGIHVPSHIMLNVGRRVVDPETFLKLVRKAEQKWQKNILEKLPHLRGRP